MNSLDCQVLGLTMNIVGIVAFANSIVFRRPRQVIEEFFGTSRPRLKHIKDHVFRKVHTYFGLGFLLVGFVLQILAALPITRSAEGASRFLPYALLSVVAVGAVGEVIATRYSRRSFRRHLRRFFRAYPTYPLERNPEITKEIGEIFDLPIAPDETVEGYARRLRDKVGITEELKRGPAKG